MISQQVSRFGSLRQMCVENVCTHFLFFLFVIFFPEWEKPGLKNSKADCTKRMTPS